MIGGLRERFRILSDDFNLPADLIFIEVLHASSRASDARGFFGPHRKADCIAYLVFIVGRYKMRNVQCKQSGPLGPLNWPKDIDVPIPFGQSGDEVRLRRPYDSIVHCPIIFQALEQHGIEARSTNDLANRKAGKACKYITRLWILASLQQEFGVVLEARNKIIDMISKLGIAAIDVRQIRIDIAGFLRPRRPHLVGIYVVPFDSYF